MKPINDQVWNPVWYRVRDQVGNQFWQVGKQVTDAFLIPVWDQIWDQVLDQDPL